MSTDLPKVSVVITCYNYGAYVASCLNSVCSQTFRDYEMIIVNDGSTDNSEEQIKPYLNGWSVKYFKQENKGQANAKNRGIRESSGTHIAFLDADDVWAPEKLEKQMPLFHNERVGVVYSGQKFINHNGKVIPGHPLRKTLIRKSGKVTDALFMDNFIPFSSAIVKRKCIEDFGGFDESLAMGIDWDLWLRISTSYLFEFVDEPLLIYRIGHPGQMSKNETKRHECSDQIMAKFLEENPYVISKRLLNDAMSFTYCNRAIYYSPRNLTLSNQYYKKSITLKPLQKASYIGIFKNIIKRALKIVTWFSRKYL